MEQIGLLVSAPKFGDIFSNLCTWKLLDGGGKEKACDSQMFVFLFLPLGRVCLSTSLNHSHRLQSEMVPRHSASCAASVGRSDFDIQSHRVKASVYLTVTKTLIICRI